MRGQKKQNPGRYIRARVAGTSPPGLAGTSPPVHSGSGRYIPAISDTPTGRYIRAISRLTTWVAGGRGDLGEGGKEQP
jgi:hypothetical protein